MRSEILLLCFLGSSDLVWTWPIAQDSPLNPEDVKYAEEYLRKFYPPTRRPPTRLRRHGSTFEEKIQKMQEFYGLEVTGRLNAQTLEVMKRPRCGVPDVENYSFYPNRPRWRNQTITYRIQKHTPDLRKEVVEASFRAALKIWSQAAPIKFVKLDRGEADIMITFGSKGHGDFFPFDGPTGVLAHAFEPGEGIGGDVHFDEDEIWTVGRQKLGYSLVTVAAHELGHSLGLGHSRDPAALMYPSYRYFNMARYSLPRDDTLAIQALYGTDKRGVPTLSNPEKCDPSVRFDAVAVIQQEVAFFKNGYVWLRKSWTGGMSRLRGGYVTTYLPGITTPVDAAYDISGEGVAYVFAGDRYWMVEHLNQRNSQSTIYDFGFPQRVKRIDAAVHISEYGKTYFFIDDVYYRYDEGKYAMDPGFPRRIHTDWLGIGKVDAVFETAGYIHFFSGTSVLSFDYREGRVQHVMQANVWLGC